MQHNRFYFIYIYVIGREQRREGMDIAYTCNHASFNLNAARSRLELAWINRGERSRARAPPFYRLFRSLERIFNHPIDRDVQSCCVETKEVAYDTRR